MKDWERHRVHQNRSRYKKKKNNHSTQWREEHKEKVITQSKKSSQKAHQYLKRLFNLICTKPNPARAGPLSPHSSESLGSVFSFQQLFKHGSISLPRMFISLQRHTRCQTGFRIACVLFRTACYVTGPHYRLLYPMHDSSRPRGSDGGGRGGGVGQSERPVLPLSTHAERPLGGARGHAGWFAPLL